MKFGANLQAHLTPEWRSQYIDYEVLKQMLYECKEDVPTSEARIDEITVRNVARFEEHFFAECDIQLTKVNTFFAEKLAEATRRFAFLQSELQAHKDALNAATTKFRAKHSLRRRVSRAHILFNNEHKVHIKTSKDLKLAFSEFYLNLVLLQNYQELNFTGFRKILKKHDKMLNTDKGVQWRVNHVETSPFHKNSTISEYISKTENLFINDLEHGDRAKAMKRLRVPPLTDTRTYPKGTVFRVGLFLGMFIIMIIVAGFAAVYTNLPEDPWHIVYLYRGGFGLFLFITCLGFNIWGWRLAGVNHVLIFEIDPRQHLSHQHFFEVAGIFSIIWSLGVIAFLFGRLPLLHFYPAYLSPLLVCASYLTFLLNPLPIFFHKARFWLLKRLWRLIACGFYPVEFADFWIADQLNSLVSVLLDFEFVICFYSVDGNIWHGPNVNDDYTPLCGTYSYGVRAVIGCYPAFIRFVQCLRRFHDSRKWFPHLVNAGKYSTTFFKQTFRALYILHLESTHELRSVYFYLYLASLFVNSCYTLAWDVKMDWGFLDSNAGENKFLREEIVYPYKTAYYLAIIQNSMIRFSWIVQVAVQQTHSMETTLNAVVMTVLSLLEVLRRFIWNFFRLENEHLNNCGEFRAVRDISVAPLRSDDLAKLEQMIEEIYGADRHLLKSRGRRGAIVCPSLTSVDIDPIRRSYVPTEPEVKVLISSNNNESEESQEGTSTSHL